MTNEEVNQVPDNLGFGQQQPGRYIHAIDEEMEDYDNGADEESEDEQPASPPANLEALCEDGRPRCQSRRQDRFQCTWPQHRLYAPNCKRHAILLLTKDRRDAARTEREENDEVDSEVRANKKAEKRLKIQLDRYNQIHQTFNRVQQRRQQNDQRLQQQRAQRGQLRNQLRANNQPA